MLAFLRFTLLLYPKVYVTAYSAAFCKSSSNTWCIFVDYEMFNFFINTDAPTRLFVNFGIGELVFVDQAQVFVFCA